VAIVLSIAVGILDGLGLSMFLPLLEMVSNQSGGAAENGFFNVGCFGGQCAPMLTKNNNEKQRNIEDVSFKEVK
jgi:hypothetical protein